MQMRFIVGNKDITWRHDDDPSYCVQKFNAIDYVVNADLHKRSGIERCDNDIYVTRKCANKIWTEGAAFHSAFHYTSFVPGCIRTSYECFQMDAKYRVGADTKVLNYLVWCCFWASHRSTVYHFCLNIWETNWILAPICSHTCKL